MKAAVLMEVNTPLVIEDVSLPKPGPREVLIRTSVAGLCHSDLHFMEGLYPHPLPAVLGHESAGIVEQVAVIGCGGVGMAAINGAEIAGAGRIIAIDTNPAKLQLATKLGATDIIDPKNGDVVQQVRELTKGGVHHAFEVLGRKETAEQAFAMLAPGGTATIVGMIPFGQKIELHGFDFLRERRIQGSSMGSNHFRVDMPRLVEFYMRGRLHLEDWISAKLKLSEINEGFANMKAGKTVRSVIMFDA